MNRVRRCGTRSALNYSILTRKHFADVSGEFRQLLFIAVQKSRVTVKLLSPPWGQFELHISDILHIGCFLHVRFFIQRLRFNLNWGKSAKNKIRRRTICWSRKKFSPSPNNYMSPPSSHIFGAYRYWWTVGIDGPLNTIVVLFFLLGETFKKSSLYMGFFFFLLVHKLYME